MYAFIDQKRVRWIGKKNEKNEKIGSLFNGRNKINKYYQMAIATEDSEF